MSSIVWRVTTVVLVVIVIVLGVSAYDSNRMYERDTVAFARDVARTQLETILQSLRTLMQDRDSSGIEEVIAGLTQSDPVYREMRLVSHGGTVVASRTSVNTLLEQESRPCAACHSLEDPVDGIAFKSFDEVIELPGGVRAVSVVTPILNEQACSVADCHAHAESEQVLGLLEASFSLEDVDRRIAQRNYHTALAVLVAVLLSMVAVWLTLDLLIGKRIKILISGMKRVADNDFSFRFEDPRKDEIAALARSFDSMTSRLSSTLSALRDTKDYLEGIVENSADMIITVDPSGLIKTVNKGAETTLGYRRTELIGQRIEKLFADPRERDVAIARLKHTDNVVNYETHFLTKRGESRDVILTLSRLRAPDGNAVGTFGISKDITREKRLQRELILNEKLVAVGQAVTGIQHSVKNMLNSLKGGSYMVNIGLEDGDRRLMEEGWAMVQEGIERLTQLSSRMLHYVKEWEPEIEGTDLHALLESVYKVSCETARMKGIELGVETSDLPTLKCDARLVHSVLMDLLSNALEACVRKEYSESEKPKIVLKAGCREAESSVSVEVSDNGEGMTDGVRRNIFTPFFSTRKKLGIGMGLTLSLRIIRMHGGSIEVESEPGKGSVFRILLPVGGPQQVKEELDAKESPDH